MYRRRAGRCGDGGDWRGRRAHLVAWTGRARRRAAAESGRPLVGGGVMRRSGNEWNVRFFGWTAVIVVKVVVVVAFHLWSLSTGRGGLAPVVVGGGDDGEYYLAVAEQIANTGATPLFVTSVWPVVVAELMRVTGWPGVLVFKLLLLSASLGTAVVGVRLLRMLTADVYRARAGAAAEVQLAALLTLFPSTLWVSSYSIYRDAVIYFFVMVSVYGVYRWLVRGDRRALVAFSLAMWGLIAFRWYAAVTVGAGALLWMLLSRGRPETLVKRRLAAVAVLSAAVGVVVASGQMSFFTNALSSRDLFESTGAGSNLGLSYSGSSVFVWPAIYLYTFATNVLGPLPNQIDGATTLAGFVLEVPLLAFCLWRVIRSPLSRTGPALLLLAVASVWFMLIAIYNDNVGTGLRLRVVGYQLVFVVVASDLAVARVRARAQRRRRRGARARPVHA